MKETFNSLKEEKFNEVYQSHVNNLFKVCLFLTLERSKAMDLTEKTFLEFYENLEEIHPEYVFTYLVNTARRLCDE